MKDIYCTFVALALVAVRVWIGLNVPPARMTGVDVFKDISHLFVGLLIGLCWGEHKTWQWHLIVLLCVAEVAVAVVSRL